MGRIQAKQVKEECNEEERESMGYLDRVVLCANTCGGHALVCCKQLDTTVLDTATLERVELRVIINTARKRG